MKCGDAEKFLLFVVYTSFACRLYYLLVQVLPLLSFTPITVLEEGMDITFEGDEAERFLELFQAHCRIISE